MSLTENFQGGADLALGVPKLERETLHDRVYLELKKAIISGAITPGTTISIRALAQALGTSPMPAREALRRLVAERALEMLPNRTIKVPVMTAERFEEIRLIRVALEGLATEVAAAQLSSTEIKRLEQLNRDMMRRTGRASADYLARNHEFHFIIYNAARLPLLMGLIESLWLQIGPLLNHVTMELGLRAAHDHHGAAMKALKTGDGAAARVAIEADITEAGKMISMLIRGQTGSGADGSKRSQRKTDR